MVKKLEANIDELCVMCEAHHLDITSIVESWSSSNIEDNELFIDNYWERLQ